MPESPASLSEWGRLFADCLRRWEPVFGPRAAQLMALATVQDAYLQQLSEGVPMPEKGNCRSCKAPLLWVRSATTGALMPLDAEPVEDGNIWLVEGVAHVHHGSLFEEMLPEGPKYKSHFATCVNAAQHRKKKEKPK